MRKSLILAVCLLFVTAAAAQAEKIGVFSMNAALSQSDVQKAVSAKLKARFDPKEQALMKEREKLAAQVKTLTPSSPDSKKQEAMKAQEAYVKKSEELYKEVQAAQTDASREIEGILTEATASYAKSNGYNMLITAEAVPYYDSSYDVTKDIIKEMNSVYAKKKK